jgi:hypothetical protein
VITLSSFHSTQYHVTWPNQWPFAQHSPDSCKTRANLARRKLFFLKNDFWQSWQIWQNMRPGISQIWQIWLFFKLGHFMYQKHIFLCIKQSSLPLPNLSYLPNLPCASHKINSKKVFLANASILRNWIKLPSTRIC